MLLLIPEKISYPYLQTLCDLIDMREDHKKVSLGEQLIVQDKIESEIKNK